MHLRDDHFIVFLIVCLAIDAFSTFKNCAFCVDQFEFQLVTLQNVENFKGIDTVLMQNTVDKCMCCITTVSFDITTISYTEVVLFAEEMQPLHNNWEASRHHTVEKKGAV